MYYQLIYVSERPIHVSNLCLSSILQSCQKNNRELGITGVLLSESRHFFHVLEGEEAAVKATFEKIKKDPRHADIHIYLERHKEKRDFAETWMAFRDMNADDAGNNCFELTRDLVLRLALAEADDIIHGLVMDFLALCGTQEQGKTTDTPTAA